MKDGSKLKRCNHAIVLTKAMPKAMAKQEMLNLFTHFGEHKYPTTFAQARDPSVLTFEVTENGAATLAAAKADPKLCSDSTTTTTMLQHYSYIIFIISAPSPTLVVP